MKTTPLEHWTSAFVEQPSDNTARLITASVRERLRLGEKLRVLESDRRRLGMRVRLEDHSPIAFLPLPSRLIHALRCAGVETLGDLNGVSEDDLCRWRNIGPSSVDQLRKSLAAAGRALRPTASTVPRRT